MAAVAVEVHCGRGDGTLASVQGRGQGGSQICLGHRQSIESELVQRNREIAKVRDLLRQRELELQEWKNKHGDLVGKLSDMDGELTKTKARHRQNSVTVPPGGQPEAGSVPSVDAEKRQEAERLAIEQCMQLDKLRQELQEERARTKAALDAKEALQEVAEGRHEKDRAAQAATQRAAELEVEVESLRAKVEAAKAEAADAIQQATDARASAADLQERVEQETARVEASGVIAGRIEELEERLATERHGIAGQLRALEEQLSCERRARREAEGRHAVVTGDLKEAVEGLAATAAQLEASEAASLARSQEIHRLRAEGAQFTGRIVTLEDQLRASSHFEPRARALQTECAGLRSEANMLRRQCQELKEGFAMVAEESQSQKMEAAGENTRLRLQLEETRRARSLEMHALVTKMCAGAATPLVKQET